MVLTQQQVLELAAKTFMDIFYKWARIERMPDGYAKSMKIIMDNNSFKVKIDYQTKDGKPLDLFLDEGTKGHEVKPKDGGVLAWDGFFSKGHFVPGIKGKFVLKKSLKEFKRVFPKVVREAYK